MKPYKIGKHSKLTSSIFVLLIIVAIPMSPPVYAQDWRIGEIVGLCKGTRIYEGPGYNYRYHTVVPENDWAVKIIGGPRNGDWWDTSRREADDPSGGTGWVKKSEAESCKSSAPPQPPADCSVQEPPPAIGKIIGLPLGMKIYHGPVADLNTNWHTVVPEDNWAVKVTGGPRYVVDREGREWEWWDTSRREACDPSGGTGWIPWRVRRLMPTPTPKSTVTPAATSPPIRPTPTPMSVPTPVPSQTLCGELVEMVTESRLTAYGYSGILPCGGQTPYLFDPKGAGPLPAGKFYRFYDPVIIPTGPLRMRGYPEPITNALIRWSQVEVLESCSECGASAPTKQQGCVPSQCAPEAVLFMRGLLSGLSTSARGCIVYVDAFEEDLLGGNVRTVSLIQPLRNIPLIGHAVDAVYVVRAEKWAVEIVKALQGEQSFLDAAWVIFTDVAVEALAAKSVGKTLELWGMNLTITEAKSHWLVGPVLRQIVEDIQQSANWWRKWYDAKQSWPYANLQHCVDVGRLACTSDYVSFLEEYPETFKYLDKAQVLYCADSAGEQSGKGVQGTVNTDRLNVRSGPGTNYPVVDGLGRGASVSLLEVSPDHQWAHVRLANDREGWVYVPLLKPSGPLEEVPVAKETPAPPAPPPQPKRPTGEKLVLGNYFAWYDADGWDACNISAGDKPLQSYGSDDPQTIARHVQMAMDGGLDGFTLHWFAPGERTDRNFATLLAQSQGKNFRSTVVFSRHIWHGSPAPTQQNVIEAVRYLLDTYSSHPNFLHYQGKPVIFFTDVYRVPVENGQTPQQAWAAIRRQVDPDGQVWWIAEGLDPSYLTTFDGLYVYKITHADYPNDYVKASRWAGQVRAWEQRTGKPKLWIATLTPGWDDMRSGCKPDVRVPSKPHRRDREDGAFYRATFDAALRSNPDWLWIHSFNEWVEGTYIEPSVMYGDKYMQMTREFVQQFKR